MIGHLVAVTSFLGKLFLPFRGRRDDDQSVNKGVFREFIEFLAKNYPLLRDHI